MSRRKTKENATVTPDEKNTPAPAAAPRRKPRISVLERRLADPFGGGSEPIHLKEEGMATRWVNTALEGRYQRATQVQGWTPVHTEELADPNEIAGLAQAPDGLVRRGERGQEILMKMPADIFEQIQWRKTEVRRERDRSSQRTKSDLLNALANRHGAEAADYMAEHMRGEVTESIERVEAPVEK